MNELLRTLARITRPLSRPIAGNRWFPLWANIHYTGRKSGRAYQAPIVVRPTANVFIVPLPFDGAQWVRNVMAAGGATLRWHGAEVPVTAPRIVGPADGMPAFNRVQRALLRAGGVDRFLRLSRVR